MAPFHSANPLFFFSKTNNLFLKTIHYGTHKTTLRNQLFQLKSGKPQLESKTEQTEQGGRKGKNFHLALFFNVFQFLLKEIENPYPLITYGVQWSNRKGAICEKP
ncbi:hypothetical protein TNIN_217441 [Trichonephila inaurata madagascariensis]|uniref:Uncharacterized protein n=1 Tax=Trichonephila inaurata madagascariensis TaxID=2747483 RepID=A0A8X7C808_9ARAC|nr:hypothetical protein TNIN_217441 [Trichonephila inaurata madagascariensis]